MSYLVLARKYRPQRFSEIVGQDHVVITLRNAIKLGIIWHAYIFSGTRGTGKTSTARIFAKAINCLSPTADFEPCNKCKNCIEITQGNCVDVVEIDAASNRGIDEIRSLRESVKYVPVSCKYKVYIIDEAHQITEAAFNAFLKTLEEPPNYVIFILATTEFNALPLTIVSRCQVFQFRPVQENVILERLKYVVKQENKHQKLTEDALQLIAENANGSVRDALSILDQIFALTEIYPIVDAKLIKEMWGITPNELVERYVKLLVEGDLKKILDFVDEIYVQGIDLIQFSKDVLEFFRKLFYFKTAQKVDNTYNLEKFKEYFSTSHLISYIQQLLYLFEEIKRSDFPKLVFELYSVKLTKQYYEISEILKELESTNFPEPSFTIQSKQVAEENTQTNKIETQQSQQKIEDLQTLWKSVLEKIKIEKPLSYPILKESELYFYNNTIKIYLPNKYVKNMIEQHNLEIEKYLEQISGKKINVLYEVKDVKKVVVGEELPQPNFPEGMQPIVVKLKKDKLPPEVEKLMETFSGKLVDTEQNE